MTGICLPANSFAISLEGLSLRVVDAMHEFTPDCGREGCSQFAIQGGETCAKISKFLKLGALFLDMQYPFCYVLVVLTSGGAHNVLKHDELVRSEPG